MATTAENFDFKPRRGKARLRTGIPAALVTMDGRQELSLVDLSESGARLALREAASSVNLSRGSMVNSSDA